MNLCLGHSIHIAHREPVHLETLQVRPSPGHWLAGTLRSRELPSSLPSNTF